MKEQNKNKFGIFYTCYKEINAVDYSIEVLRSIYQDIPIYLVSDGGHDFSFLENKYLNIKTFLEEDTRSIIPELTIDNFKDEINQKNIKKSILCLFDRIKRAIQYCDCEYLLIMEPDVLLRNKISIPNVDLLGTRINNGLSDELRTILRNTEGAIDINTWGATPAIFNSRSFIKAVDKLILNKKLFNDLCLSEYRLSYYDILICVLFSLIGSEETFNPEIIECFRDHNWTNSWHPLVHQFRAKYPLSSEGYNGTHIKHKDGLGDTWLWNR